MRTSPRGVELLPEPLTIQAVEAVARGRERVSLGAKSLKAMTRSRRTVEAALKDGQPHYGLNTGFGALAKQRIGPVDLRTLQRNLIRSHSAGVGAPLRTELVRAVMTVLAGSLARGLSGVRPVVVETLAAMLNRGVTPVVPSIGSVGASGDLAPLAHIALTLIGEGHATLTDRAGRPSAPMPSAKALARARIRPLTLEAKEGLALINGTHLMCAEGALLCADALRLQDAAVVALALSIDACRATHAFLDARLYAARGHEALALVALQLRTLLEGSRVALSHAENDPRVQDPYSLRAGPTVLGAVNEAVDHVQSAMETELGAVTDNPLVFTGRGDYQTDVNDFMAFAADPLGDAASLEAAIERLGRRNAGVAMLQRDEGPAVLSGANFHGLPIALPLDYLAVALAHLAGVSERRTYLITGAFEPESRLKPFLAPRPGLQSGLMIAQYTAAACVNELVGLATPASVANVPTCAGMEDYNSFGPRAAAKARRGIELAQRVVAIELLCAAQGLESHRPLRSGAGVERAMKAIRRVVKPLADDRPLTADIEAIAGLIAEGEFSRIVDGE